MTDRAVKWGFYGREKELNELQGWLKSPQFNSVSVIGGRGVGKTALITEAIKTLERQKPYIYVEVPDINRNQGRKKPSDLREDVNKELAKQARAAGLEDALPPPSPYIQDNQFGYFKELLDGLLRRGAVVVLDEFQNVRELDLVSYVKMVIDRLKLSYNSDGGKIVVAGSHQQKILDMLFDVSEPMYNRIDGPLLLHPMESSEVLEMAAARGWLGKPYRFLTAYTAFGGSPYRWRRLFEDQGSGKVPEPTDGQDRTWRKEFVTREFLRRRYDQNESFFNAAYVNLSPEARDVALELAQNPRGVRWNSVVEQCGGADGTDHRAQDGFRILEHHLKIAEFIPESGLSANPVTKARLTDHAALFELNIRRPDFGLISVTVYEPALLVPAGFPGSSQTSLRLVPGKRVRVWLSSRSRPAIA